MPSRHDHKFPQASSSAFLCAQYFIRRFHGWGKADVAGAAVTLDCVANKKSPLIVEHSTSGLCGLDWTGVRTLPFITGTTIFLSSITIGIKSGKMADMVSLSLFSVCSNIFLSPSNWCLWPRPGNRFLRRAFWTLRWRCPCAQACANARHTPDIAFLVSAGECPAADHAWCFQNDNFPAWMGQQRRRAHSGVTRSDDDCIRHKNSPINGLINIEC